MSGLSEFDTRLGTLADHLDIELRKILSDSAEPGEIVRPPKLLEAMRYGVLNGGKRLRPFLLVESACMFGATGGGVVQAACALELIHCYSLIHDDLPAMDDDDLRRGKPTVHKLYGDATAILAGDSLLTLAFAVMAGEGVHADGLVRADLVQGMAGAAGPGGMAGGQVLDLAAESADGSLSEDAIRQLQAMKTGALIRFACEAGGILGLAAADERQALKSFGASLGFLFQVTDDILDAESDAATLGKMTGKDAARNKATLVSLFGLEEAKKIRVAEAEAAAALLQPFGRRADMLRSALLFACERAH